jgi:hypothetical protein
MSIEKTNWAFAQQIKPTTWKFVLVALSDCSARGGCAFPSTSMLCWMTSLNWKTVTKALDGLEKLGFIRDTGKRTGQTKQIKVYEVGPGVKDSLSWESFKEVKPPKPEMKASQTRDESLPNQESTYIYRTEGTEGTASGFSLSANSNEKKAPKTDEKPESKKDGKFSLFNDLWCKAFESHFGSKYCFSGSRDGKASKALIAATGKTPEELIALIQRTWTKKGRNFFYCSKASTIHGFQTYFNQIIAELKNESQPETVSPRIIDGSIGTANEGLAHMYEGQRCEFVEHLVKTGALG